jgi:signal transduction histidine kinase
MSSAVALVVDDNPELAENVCEMLDSIEHPPVKCVLAASAGEGRKLAEAHGTTVDLAVIDLRLPDSDGMNLVGDVRARCPFAQVVIITGDATLESAIAAVREGAFAYLLKPFAAKELVQTAARAIAQAGLLRERDQLRRELEESERRHRELVEGVPAFVLALDAGGRIVVWNRRLEEATGSTRVEMLGRPGIHVVGNGGDRKLVSKDGAHRLVRWQLTEVGVLGGTITYALGIDVTNERDMLRRTLRAERLAAVGTLAAGLAHEVRNPLNSATLQLQVLKRRLQRGTTSVTEVLPIAGVVEDEIERLDRLVSDFLAFAQPKPLELVQSDLNSLVESVATLIAPEAESTRVSIELKLDPETGFVEAEPARMRQVLLNLTRNAIEAMSDGGTLSLGTRRSDDEGNVSIVVEDTGPGFAEDAPIFDAFYSTKPTGTGLGLAIVHRIVGEHGGTISAESQPRRTSFTIKLPQSSKGNSGDRQVFEQ